MELRHLRYFCAVAAEKNMTKAADSLFMAQPPLTRQIKQLEEEMGVKLLERQARGVALTKAGNYFWRQAQQILEKLDSTVIESQRIHNGETRLFRIGFVPSVFYGQLPQIIRRLRQTTKIEVELLELKTGEQVEALREGKLDIGFGRILMPAIDDEVIQTLLYREPILAALPQSHPLAHSNVSITQLAELPMIIYPAGPPPTFASICLDLFTSRGLKVNISQQVNDVQTAMGLVASEMGFTLVPEQVKRMNRDDVAFVELEETLTSPVILSRRSQDNDEIMNDVLHYVAELYELN